LYKDDILKKSYAFVRDIFKKCSPELNFKFYGNNGRVIIEVSNLEELISALQEIPAVIAHFHIYRSTTAGLFDSAPLDGPVIRSDIALWINYVLGDSELSRRVYDAGTEESNPIKLKERVINILKQRERELIDLLKKTA